MEALAPAWPWREWLQGLSECRPYLDGAAPVLTDSATSGSSRMWLSSILVSTSTAPVPVLADVLVSTLMQPTTQALTRIQGYQQQYPNERTDAANNSISPVRVTRSHHVLVLQVAMPAHLLLSSQICTADYTALRQVGTPEVRDQRAITDMVITDMSSMICHH
jgi:hypothetical protein